MRWRCTAPPAVPPRRQHAVCAVYARRAKKEAENNWLQRLASRRAAAAAVPPARVRRGGTRRVLYGFCRLFAWVEHGANPAFARRPEPSVRGWVVANALITGVAPSLILARPSHRHRYRHRHRRDFFSREIAGL